MPVVKTKGSASSQGFGEFAQQGGGDANWIDDVFSTYLYTGTGALQSINNGIDLATKGGMVWNAGRSSGNPNVVSDSARGSDYGLQTFTTGGQWAGHDSTYTTTGFTLNTDTNQSGYTYASWTFAKQAKFFDVVTWTGDGASYRTITHNLGSSPGCVIVKRTDASANWVTYFPNDAKWLTLNTTNAAGAANTANGYPTATTATDFLLSPGTGPNVTAVNANGGTYVAYLFAHNAGGFGTAGTDNVISCGSYTGNGSATGPTVTLGYEPQYLLIKNTTTSGYDWMLVDSMRGFTVASSQDNFLRPNTSDAETTAPWVSPLATGFQLTNANDQVNASGSTYIYIAIRRPMKPPTTGTSVFKPNAQNFATTPTATTGFPVDMLIQTATGGSAKYLADRLRGSSTTSYRNLNTTSTSAESSGSGAGYGLDNNTGFVDNWANYSSGISWSFARAPGFFDEVCYTGDGGFTDFNHNLNAIPELIICKKRSSTSNWAVQWTGGNPALARTGLSLNTTNSALYTNYDLTGVNTKTTFEPYFVIDSSDTTSNASGSTYVAYLFATVAGVSKVGSYTGTGTVTQTINAGFGAGGARWVMIKRTDSTGDWYVFDTARGFTSSSSPYLLMNSTATQVTGNNGCYADNTGFTLTTNASATVNINGASYIYLSVA